MQKNTYIDGHPLQAAFVANIWERFVELVVMQGEDILSDVDIEFPSRAVSSILLIGDNEKLTVADIAKTLNQPHQLVTQRIDLLLDLNVVERVPDPVDKRRKIIQLTPKGHEQYKALKARLIEAEAAFLELFDELGCDLSKLAVRAIDLLQNRPLLSRIQSQSTT
ncbi:MarR family transcriptional regulator [Kordiimonas sp. SCSIO 12610]|uniref:MarR family transcriptional regulator n=1 Tax=Kordiimonas sp. SCSIO 12610 TaxID=2829597 RepID=UPI00210D910D|nr:MarR family transcriptional regulator [Kordiimonas sp. SCSIO 12610]UTW54005.1 MarR family transcriptional regulator [Kordiimonas sp. SCSIO 12610]